MQAYWPLRYYSSLVCANARPLSCTQCQIDDTGDINGCPDQHIWTWIGRGRCMSALNVLLHWRLYLKCNACHTAKICKCANEVPPMQPCDYSRNITLLSSVSTSARQIALSNGGIGLNQRSNLCVAVSYQRPVRLI